MNMFLAVSCAGIKNLRASHLSSGSVSLLKIVFRNDLVANLYRKRSWFKDATVQLEVLLRNLLIRRCCFMDNLKQQPFLTIALLQKLSTRLGSKFLTIEHSSTYSWTPHHQVVLKLITEPPKPSFSTQIPRKWPHLELSLLSIRKHLYAHLCKYKSRIISNISAYHLKFICNFSGIQKVQTPSINNLKDLWSLPPIRNRWDAIKISSSALTIVLWKLGHARTHAPAKNNHTKESKKNGTHTIKH